MIMLESMQYYTPDEAAAVMGISPQALQGRIRRGTIKAVRISGKLHITGDELKAEAERRRNRGRKRGADA